MFPYQRVVQWLAGPVSAGIGLVATAVVHQNISKSASLNVATYVLSGGATYLAHHKWLDNVPKWWDHEKQVEPKLTSDAEQIATDIGPEVTRVFDEITAHEQAAQKVQEQPGTSADQVQHGLSPSPVQPQQNVTPGG